MTLERIGSYRGPLWAHLRTVSAVQRRWIGISHSEANAGKTSINVVEGDEVPRRERETRHGGLRQIAHNIAQGLHDARYRKLLPEADFKVISNGIGSVLLLKLPPGSQVMAATGTVINAALTSESNVLKAVGRKLVGEDMYYQKFSTDSDSSGDILLAPHAISDIATIYLDVNEKYIVRRSALLARSANVDMETTVEGIKGKQSGIFNSLMHAYYGPGSIAISTYGGMYRVELRQGETYCVNPSNLIAWSASTNPTKVSPSTNSAPEPRSRLRRFDFFRHLVDSPNFKPSIDFWHKMMARLRNVTAGGPEFVELTGPGDFFVASRVQPSNQRAKIMSSLDLANDRIDQLYHQQEIQVARDEQKQKQIEYAQESSDQINPTYYAHVDIDGKVRFTSARDRATVAE